MPQNETHVRVVVLVAVGGSYLTIKLGNDLTVMISRHDPFITEKIEVCIFFGVSESSMWSMMKRKDPEYQILMNAWTCSGRSTN